MRNNLWPSSEEEHQKEIEDYFYGSSPGIKAAFVAHQNEDRLAGFIELNIRNYAEGSRETEVPYVEGWYVDTDLRGKGIGKWLIDAAETWANTEGYHELASDAELENSHSIKAHKASGFREVERIVCFIKPLS